MRIVVILPTYNEGANIAPLLRAVSLELERISHDSRILVVDDNSPDGTGDRVREIQRIYPKVHLLQDDRAGLGAAYTRGMRYALDTLDAEVVFEMDADFSHKPEDIPRLMAQIEAGYDFVIGSRYVPGGTIPDNWGILRRAMSIGGNSAVRLIAGQHPIRDWTGGFRAIRATVLRKIELNDLKARGYVFQVALLNAAREAGARIREIPIDFVERAAGESKLGFPDAVEFMLRIWRIRKGRRTRR